MTTIVEKTCPFCGAYPTIEPWHGGGPNKHMVHCENDECAAGPSVTGATKNKAIEAWNRREGDAGRRIANGVPASEDPPSLR